jgi:hypothetical protein
LDVARDNFQGEISYSAGPWENVPWNRVSFDVVGETLYYTGESLSDYIYKIKKLQSYDRPVHIKEFGSSTYSTYTRGNSMRMTSFWVAMYGKKEGADKYIGRRPMEGHVALYNEDTQAEHVRFYLNIFNRMALEGCFLYEFEAREPKNPQEFGIVDVPLKRRKKAFYMYKSYQRPM